jgi:hypothetical protein
MMPDLRGYTLVYVIYLYLVSRRPPIARSTFVISNVDLAKLRADRMKQLAYIPSPESWLEKIFHYLSVRWLTREADGLTQLIDMGVVLSGMTTKGGEADKTYSSE